MPPSALYKYSRTHKIYPFQTSDAQSNIPDSAVFDFPLEISEIAPCRGFPTFADSCTSLRTGSVSNETGVPSCLASSAAPLLFEKCHQVLIRFFFKNQKNSLGTLLLLHILLSSMIPDLMQLKSCIQINLIHQQVFSKGF